MRAFQRDSNIKRFLKLTQSASGQGRTKKHFRHRQLRSELLEDRCLLTAGLVEETGDFVAEIQRWKDLAFATDSNSYVAPTANEQAAFAQLTANLLDGDLASTAGQAASLDYELVEFTDAGSGRTFYELREQLVDGQPTRGWGTYAVNLGFQVDRLVEVPHPVFDTNSWDLGAKVFNQSGARAFLMAGAHRHANGTGGADVAHLEESIFQTVHEVWNGPTGQTTAWQIHGFDLDGHDTFPAGTDLVVSNGDGGVSTDVIDLDSRFDDHQFQSHAYNTLSATDPLNIAVNDGIDGTTFSSLAATTNVQGIHSRLVGGTFLHAEFEQSIRFNQADRAIAASLVSDSLSSEATFFVATANVTGTTSSALQLTATFNQPVDDATLQATDVSIDGVPAVAVTLTDSTTAVFDLPALAPGSYLATITAGTIADQTQLGVNQSHFRFDVEASGTKFYVVDTAGDETFQYDAAGNFLTGYDLDDGNTTPRGAAADATGQTVWVIDADDFVYVYDEAGSRQGKWKARGLSLPEGIASDGEHVWIVDRGTDRVYFFDGAAQREKGRTRATSSFALADGNTNPRGITTDGTNLWVVNWVSGNNEVYKYSSNGTPLGNWAIDDQNNNPRGITIDPTNPNHLWIVDNGTDAVYQYLGSGNRISGSQAADAVWQLAAADSNPQGIADPPPPAELTTQQYTAAQVAGFIHGELARSEFSKTTTKTAAGRQADSRDEQAGQLPSPLQSRSRLVDEFYMAANDFLAPPARQVDQSESPDAVWLDIDLLDCAIPALATDDAALGTGKC